MNNLSLPFLNTNDRILIPLTLSLDYESEGSPCGREFIYKKKNNVGLDHTITIKDYNPKWTYSVVLSNPKYYDYRTEGNKITIIYKDKSYDEDSKTDVTIGVTYKFGKPRYVNCKFSIENRYTPPRATENFTREQIAGISSALAGGLYLGGWAGGGGFDDRGHNRNRIEDFIRRLRSNGLYVTYTVLRSGGGNRSEWELSYIDFSYLPFYLSLTSSNYGVMGLGINSYTIPKWGISVPGKSLTVSYGYNFTGSVYCNKFGTRTSNRGRGWYNFYFNTYNWDPVTKSFVLGPFSENSLTDSRFIAASGGEYNWDGVPGSSLF